MNLILHHKNISKYNCREKSMVFAMEASRCLEDKAYTELRLFFIKTSDGNNFADAFNYCKKCKKYLSGKNMEENIKKVALDFIRNFNHSYKLSDIIEVSELK